MLNARIWQQTAVFVCCCDGAAYVARLRLLLTAVSDQGALRALGTPRALSARATPRNVVTPRGRVARIRQMPAVRRASRLRRHAVLESKQRTKIGIADADRVGQHGLKNQVQLPRRADLGLAAAPRTRIRAAILFRRPDGVVRGSSRNRLSTCSVWRAAGAQSAGARD
jgi:hypothetical protein